MAPNNTKAQLVARLRPKSLGNPKAAAAFSDEDMAAGKVHWLGTLMGRCSAVSPVKDQKDETKITGMVLLGFFEGIPADETKPRMKSGKCWLPGGVHELVVEQVESAEDGAVVEFAYKIGTKRDTNAAGYSYIVEPIGEIAQADPLADMRRQLGDQLALPAPAERAAQAEAPPKRARARR